MRLIRVLFIQIAVAGGAAVCACSGGERVRDAPSSANEADLRGAHASSAARAEAKKWIAEHPEKIPRTYDEIIRYPYWHRVEIYARLSPEEKSAIWRTQIERYRLKHTVTPEQQAVIDRFLQKISPDQIDQVPSEAETRSFDEAARQAFGRLAWTLFAQIGDESTDPAEAFGRTPSKATDAGL